MIDYNDLEILLAHFSINLEIITKKNKSILEKGKYNEIYRTLNYLINELGILSSDIEKCPSIIYSNCDNIKENLKYLEDNNVDLSYIKKHLSLLSKETYKLKESYDFEQKNTSLKDIRVYQKKLEKPKKTL